MKLFLEYVFAPNKVWYLLQNRLSFLFAHHTSIDLKTEGGGNDKKLNQAGGIQSEANANL